MEYFVKCWGGAFNNDASPSIEKDTGIKEGSYYFNEKENMERFISYLNKPEYKKQGLVFVTKESDKLSHKRTIYEGVYEYKGNEYTIVYDFGYEYDEKDAIYMFTYGNYSCDCNLSIFINEQYPGTFKDEDIPLDCGSTIKLKSYKIRYED